MLKSIIGKFLSTIGRSLLHLVMSKLPDKRTPCKERLLSIIAAMSPAASSGMQFPVKFMSLSVFVLVKESAIRLILDPNLLLGNHKFSNSNLLLYVAIANSLAASSGALLSIL